MYYNYLCHHLNMMYTSSVPRSCVRFYVTIHAVMKGRIYYERQGNQTLLSQTARRLNKTCIKIYIMSVPYMCRGLPSYQSKWKGIQSELQQRL